MIKLLEPNKTYLVLYKGGGYEGCGWEYNHYIFSTDAVAKIRPESIINSFSTGVLGLEDSELTPKSIVFQLYGSGVFQAHMVDLTDKDAVYSLLDYHEALLDQIPDDIYAKFIHPVLVWDEDESHAFRRGDNLVILTQDPDKPHILIKEETMLDEEGLVYEDSNIIERGHLSDYGSTVEALINDGWERWG